MTELPWGDMKKEIFLDYVKSKTFLYLIYKNNLIKATNMIKILHKFTNMFTKAYFHLVNYGLLYGWGIFMTLILLMAFASCSTKKYVPIETETKVEYVDRTIYKDSTIFVEIPKEVYKEIVPVFDTLQIHSSTALFTAWVDSCTRTLQGAVKSKENSLKTNIKIPERVITRDSLVYREVPVEVEVPKPYIPRLVLWYIALSGAFLLWKFYKIFKP